MKAKVWYLAHSGFAVQTESSFLIFDYYLDEPKGGTIEQGVIDPKELAEKNVIVFVSHNHDDHFNPVVFEWQKTIPNIKYILSNDISEIPNAIMIGPNDTVEQENLVVKTYRSTDEGVAFLVQIDGLAIYHAGDLNWWHWEGELDTYNMKMADDYKKQIDLLADERIDLAFVPLDPRQERQYDWGIKYLLERNDVPYVVPMHFWNQPDVIDRLLVEPYMSCHANRICPLRHRGEYLEFSSYGKVSVDESIVTA